MKTFIIAAITADGFIARNHVEPTSWTSPEDKQHFRTLTKHAGVVIMGSNTYKTVNQVMPGRRTIVYTTHPEEITSSGVETTQESPGDLIRRLSSEGISELAVIGGATIFRQFLEAQVIDELYLTVEPLLWGQGVSLLDRELSRQLRLLGSRQLNDSSMLLHYAVG